MEGFSFARSTTPRPWRVKVFASFSRAMDFVCADCGRLESCDTLITCLETLLASRLPALTPDWLPEAGSGRCIGKWDCTAHLRKGVPDSMPVSLHAPHK